jgi:hypothetical protein
MVLTTFAKSIQREKTDERFDREDIFDFTTGIQRIVWITPAGLPPFTVEFPSSHFSEG